MNCMLNFKLVGPILALRYVIRLHRLVGRGFYKVISSGTCGKGCGKTFDFVSQLVQLKIER